MNFNAFHARKVNNFIWMGRAENLLAVESLIANECEDLQETLLGRVDCPFSSRSSLVLFYSHFVGKSTPQHFVDHPGVRQLED